MPGPGACRQGVIRGYVVTGISHGKVYRLTTEDMESIMARSTFIEDMEPVFKQLAFCKVRSLIKFFHAAIWTAIEVRWRVLQVVERSSRRPFCTPCEWCFYCLCDRTTDMRIVTMGG